MQLTEPSKIERADQFAVESGIYAIGNEAAVEPANATYNAAIRRLDDEPVLDEEEFGRRVESFAILEDLRASVVATHERLALSYADKAVEMGKQRALAVRKLEIATELAPFLELGCEPVATTVPKKRWLRRSPAPEATPICGASIPADLLQEVSPFVEAMIANSTFKPPSPRT